MVPVLSFVGRHNSGKTTFLEKVVSELKSRGYSVAVIKHHKNSFEIDTPGKDTWRLARAGSDVIVISSPEKMAMIKNTQQELTLDQLKDIAGESVDIVISEGYKYDNKPKIEVFRSEVSDKILSDEKDLIALVTDCKLETAVPQFTFDDSGGVVELIIDRFLKKQEETDVALIVNGSPVEMKPFIRDMFINTVTGLVAALHGTENAREIKITVRRP
jgi:molybdopterin-guanine dinucleotide biosynthesis protein B